jgi:hypothetical protein
MCYTAKIAEVQNMLPWKRIIAPDSNSFIGKNGKYYRRYSLMPMKILPD